MRVTRRNNRWQPIGYPFVNESLTEQTGFSLPFETSGGRRGPSNGSTLAPSDGTLTIERERTTHPGATRATGLFGTDVFPEQCRDADEIRQLLADTE
ncbi:hypothetical protein [Haloferax sp. DFSO60]|uniref:hypothetical protein n=1 Tax=Haloferax sp. DFSO60 TaxID=3388652 RepID=UPI00397C0750